MDAASAAALFDTNAASYDRVNTLISLGLDSRWRRWAAEQAAWRPSARVLDAFSGTGLVGIEAARIGARVTLADVSAGMLERACDRARQAGVDVADARLDLAEERLPLPRASFDAVTVSFGIRYLDEPRRVLRSLGELLAPDGRLVVLEFVRPERGLVSSAAAVYFFRVLPALAGVLSGRRELYDYLVRSVERIGHAGELRELLERSGFEIAERKRMGFGLVAGFVCLVRA